MAAGEAEVVGVRWANNCKWVAEVGQQLEVQSGTIGCYCAAGEALARAWR